MSNKPVFMSHVLFTLLLVLAISGLTQPMVALAGSVHDAFTDCNNQSEIPSAECQALVALYNTTNGSSWMDHNGWLQTDTPCSWSGVTCSAGHVTELYFYNNNMIGWLPAEIGNLSELRNLNLSHDGISAPIPPEVGNLSHLEALSLGNNWLTGDIPVQLGNLVNLKNLDLFGNQLTGQIPVQLANLTQLTFLSLANNKLDGSIPTGFGNLTNLTYLSLGYNQLSGSIPPELGNLSQLQTLAISQNQLSGNVPSELGRLTSLKTMTIDHNPLTGGVPVTFTALTALTSFHFDGTNLCEPITQAFQDWKAGVTDWVGTGETCTGKVAGLVKEGNQGLQDVLVSVDNGQSSWTDSDGAFTLDGLSSGLHTIRPVKRGYVFQPPFVEVTLPPDALSVSFQAQKVTQLYLTFLSR